MLHLLSGTLQHHHHGVWQWGALQLPEVNYRVHDIAASTSTVHCPIPQQAAQGGPSQVHRQKLCREKHHCWPLLLGRMVMQAIR
jgi:hypothetical protein